MVKVQKPAGFGDWVLAVQAFGILFALWFAAGQLVLGREALASDSYDRRVDRVYALHRELTTGEVNEARRRLASHFFSLRRTKRNFVRRVSRKELAEDAKYNRYKD